MSPSSTKFDSQEARGEYSCTICDATYKVKGSFQSHMRKKHKDAVTNVTKKVLKAFVLTTKAEGNLMTAGILEDILND